MVESSLAWSGFVFCGTYPLQNLLINISPICDYKNIIAQNSIFNGFCILLKLLTFCSFITVCEHAYSLAQNLDPNSEGRGVLQFKTGLMSVIKVYLTLTKWWILFSRPWKHIVCNFSIIVDIYNVHVLPVLGCVRMSMTNGFF